MAELRDGFVEPAELVAKISAPSMQAGVLRLSGERLVDLVEFAEPILFRVGVQHLQLERHRGGTLRLRGRGERQLPAEPGGGQLTAQGSEVPDVLRLIAIVDSHQQVAFRTEDAADGQGAVGILQPGVLAAGLEVPEVNKAPEGVVRNRLAIRRER